MLAIASVLVLLHFVKRNGILLCWHILHNIVKSQGIDTNIFLKSNGDLSWKFTAAESANSLFLIELGVIVCNCKYNSVTYNYTVIIWKDFKACHEYS